MKRDIKHNLIFPMWGIYFCHFVSIFLCFAAGKFYCGYGNAAASVFPVQGAGEKGALPEGHLESMGLWISGGFSGGEFWLSSASVRFRCRSTNMRRLFFLCGGVFLLQRLA